MRSFHLCFLTALLLQSYLACGFGEVAEDEDEDSGYQRGRRGWSMIRLGRGLQTLRLGKRAEDAASLTPAQVRTLLSPSSSSFMDQPRRPYRRQPPFPRYGRDLENAVVEEDAEDVDQSPHPVLDVSCIYRFLPFLDQRYTPQKRRLKRSVSSQPQQDKLSSQLSGFRDQPQLDLEAFSGGDLDELGILRTVKSVPLPRVGRAGDLFELIPPIPRAGRRSYRTFVLQENGSAQPRPGSSESSILFRAGKAVPAPRIGRGDVDTDLDRAEKSAPIPRIGRLALEMPRPLRAVPAPRIGRQDQSMSEGDKASFSYTTGSGEEDSVSVSAKAVPIPRIGRRMVITLQRSERAAPAPAVGRGHHVALLRSMRAAPALVDGQQDLLRSAKAVPTPRIGRGAAGEESRVAKAIPAPRIGRQEASGQDRSPKAVPAPRIGRQDAASLPRMLKAVPAPRIGRAPERKRLRYLKSVPTPRYGRQEGDRDMIRYQKSVPTPRYGRQNSQEFLRVLRAVPAPRIGRQYIDALNLFRTNPSTRAAHHQAAELLRFLKAVPTPRIGRQEPGKFLRVLKAVPTPRIGREEAEEVRTSKAVPSPRIGRQDSKEVARVSKAVPAPRIGRRKQEQMSMNM